MSQSTILSGPVKNRSVGPCMSSSALCVALAACGLLPLAAQAQYPTAGATCTWSPSSPGRTEIPVLFSGDPAVMASYGFDPNVLLDASISAMATWTEESQTNLDFTFAGVLPGPATGFTPGMITIDVKEAWHAPDPRLAIAFWPPSGDCRTSGALFHMMLVQSDTMTAIDWSTAHATGSEVSWQNVIVHELGHMLGISDETVTSGVMNRWYTLANANHFLYAVDQVSTAVQLTSGLTVRGPATSIALAGSGAAFATPTVVGLPSSSIAPRSSRLFDGTVAAWVLGSPQVASLDAVVYESTAATTVTPPNPFGTPANLHVSVASASSGGPGTFLLAAWQGACSISAGCPVQWAHSADGGTSWTAVQTSLGNTFAPPEVAFDPVNQKFVVAWIDYTTNEMMTTHSPVATPGFAAAVSALAGEHFRYMGGMAFGSGDALMVAALDDEFPGTELSGHIVQMGMATSLGGDYLLTPSEPMDGANPTDYLTRRHFGIAHDPASNETVVVFRGTGANRRFVSVTKVGLDELTAFSSPVGQFSDARNSVDVTWDGSRFRGVLSW